MFGRHVAMLTEPPRGPKYAIRPLEPEAARRFLVTVKGDRFGALYSVALALGLRQGEALGLRWQRVDLDRGRIRVVHQLQRVDSKLALVDSKTELSRRTLVMLASTWLKVRQHHDRQQEEKAAAGRNWQDRDLVSSQRWAGNLWKEPR